MLERYRLYQGLFLILFWQSTIIIAFALAPSGVSAKNCARLATANGLIEASTRLLERSKLSSYKKYSKPSF